LFYLCGKSVIPYVTLKLSINNNSVVKACSIFMQREYKKKTHFDWWLTSRIYGCGHTSFPWWRKTPGAPTGYFSGPSGHLGRTTDVPQASWLASSHERSWRSRTHSGEGQVILSLLNVQSKFFILSSHPKVIHHKL
jgi:hypothetical protein